MFLLLIACADPGAPAAPAAPTDTAAAADPADSAAPGDTGASPTLLVPALSGEPGDHVIEAGWEGGERTTIVTIPDSYAPGADQPLVLVLHGGGGGAPGFRQERAAFVEAAAAAGAVVVFPEGAPASDGTGHVWNAWDKARTPADDVGYLSAVIGWVGGELGLSAERVYLAGFSNGAAMTQRFAAERPEELAAAAAMCHSVRLHEPASAEQELCACDTLCSDDCPVTATGREYLLPEPRSPVPILLVRGGRDERICSDGGCGSKGVEVATAAEQLQLWLDGNGCDAAASTEETLPQGATLRRFEDCEGAPVAHIADHDLAHTWAARLDVPVLSFFLGQ